MELNTQRRVASLKEKLPEMQKSLDTVRFLSSQDVCPRLIPSSHLVYPNNAHPRNHHHR